MLLFFFPYESPEDILEKERLLLLKQIENASRVEKFGYRKKECSLPSDYIYWRCIHDYLKCPIKKWKLPKSSKEKIEIEPLPTDFLPLTKLNKPMYYYDHELKAKVRRIVGYREILHKREYAQYLGEVEIEIRNYYNGDDDVSREVESATNDEDEETDSGPEEENEEKSPSDEGNPELIVATEFSKLSRILARGGGPKKGKSKGGGGKGKGGGGKGKGGGGRKGGKSKKGNLKKGGKGAAKQGIIKRISQFFGFGNDDDSPRSAKFSKHSRKNIEKTAAQLEKENKENLEEIFKYHGMFRVPAQKEKDNEWLELSNSDTAAKKSEHEEEITTFNKAKLPWMVEGLSYESQFLAKTLKPFLIFSSLTGRSFMGTKNDFDKGHVDFLHRRRDLIVFFLSSFFFWVCFVMITVSFADIQWENQAQEEIKQGDKIDTLEAMKSAVFIARHEVEELELNKYNVPVAIVIINLLLTATWSLLMILGDGIYVAHYLNCWSAALTEMETSGSLGIRKKVFFHQLYILIYTIILVVGFYYDYPKHIRFSSGKVVALVVRSFDRTLRIRSDEDLLPYQMAGLVFQIYVMYCCSMIKLLMQLCAIILKNASEMWNFKFALTFGQLVARNRGQILQLTLNHSLTKLFTHHRILTVLLRNFGEVFCIPIMTYMVTEMGILTLVLVKMFFYTGGTPELYNGVDHILIQSHNGTPPDVKIPYYHTPAEDYLTYVFAFVLLCFQFIGTTEILAGSGASFFSGYEFVRRSGTILCKTSHQRRLIQSLEWSFSSTNPSVLSANGYFSINRESILSAFAAVVGFFSLIIQLQVTSTVTVIQFLNEDHCNKIKDHQLLYGSCELKIDLEESDLSMDYHIARIAKKEE